VLPIDVRERVGGLRATFKESLVRLDYKVDLQDFANKSIDIPKHVSVFDDTPSNIDNDSKSEVILRVYVIVVRRSDSI